MATLYPLVMGGRAMVATEHYLSAAAGARMFAAGGNAGRASLPDNLIGRPGRPEEIAEMVRYLCSPSARFITGQTIHVNGGVFLP